MKKGMYVSFNLKNFLTLILVFVLAFSLTLAYNSVTVQTTSQLIDTGKTVIVDAGHGGEDGGTQSSAGVLEKDINLAVSLKLGTILRLMGYTVVYTRSEDKLQYGADAVKQRQKKVSDIHYRMNIIKNYPGAIFLSIHQNYYAQSKYYGAQVFYSKNNEKSQLIADSLQKKLREYLQKDNDRQIKASGTDVYLLYHTTTPAVMVECGFMSNPGEALLLSEDDYQKKLSLAIAAGLEDYSLNS